MDADITSAVQDFIKCAKTGFFGETELASRNYFQGLNHWNLSLAIDILRPLAKSRCGFRYIIVIADPYNNLVHVVLLRHFRSVDVAKAVLECGAYKYGPQMTLLAVNLNLLTSKFFQRVCQFL